MSTHMYMHKHMLREFGPAAAADPTCQAIVFCFDLLVMITAGYSLRWRSSSLGKMKTPLPANRSPNGTHRNVGGHTCGLLAA